MSSIGFISSRKYIVKFYKERFYVEDEKQKTLFISQTDEPVRETVQFFTTIYKSYCDYVSRIMKILRK